RSLLAYLRTCVTATSIDYAREQAALSRIEQLAQHEVVSPPCEQAVLEKLHLADLWRLLLETTMNDQERLILRESLLYALPPRAISARHADQFSDITQVYRTKRNLFNRLQHNHAIHRLCHDEIAP